MSHAAFGHGLYEAESRLAARLAVRLRDRKAVRQALLARLPQPSPHTRERLADKLLQRLWGGQSPFPFLRLVAELTDGRARRQLLLHRIADTDTLVGALAREVFLPYVLRGALPKGIGAAPPPPRDLRLPGFTETKEAPSALPADPLIAFASRAWQAPPTSTLRALTILRQCGVLARLPHPGRHPGAYLPTGAPPALPAFVYLLHEEALWPGGGVRSVRAALGVPFLRLFLVKPPLPEALLADAAECGFVRLRGGRVSARWPDPEALVDRLLAA